MGIWNILLNGKNFKSQRDFKEYIEVFNITSCNVLNKIEVFDIQVVKSDICTPDLLVKFEVQNKTNVGFLTDKNIIRAVPTVSKKCINPLFRYFHMNNILIKRENNKVMKMNNVKTMEIRDIEKRDGRNQQKSINISFNGFIHITVILIKAWI